MTRVHVFYSGTVQGVGFRFTVQRVAGGLNVTGWVKNLADGRVELLAEGKKENIEELLDKIDRRFHGYIRAKEADYPPAQNKFKSFEITF